MSTATAKTLAVVAAMATLVDALRDCSVKECMLVAVELNAQIGATIEAYDDVEARLNRPTDPVFSAEYLRNERARYLADVIALQGMVFSMERFSRIQKTAPSNVTREDAPTRALFEHCRKDYTRTKGLLEGPLKILIDMVGD